MQVWTMTSNPTSGPHATMRPRKSPESALFWTLPGSRRIILHTEVGLPRIPTLSDHQRASPAPGVLTRSDTRMSDEVDRLEDLKRRAAELREREAALEREQGEQEAVRRQEAYEKAEATKVVRAQKRKAAVRKRRQHERTEAEAKRVAAEAEAKRQVDLSRAEEEKQAEDRREAEERERTERAGQEADVL